MLKKKIYLKRILHDIKDFKNDPVNDIYIHFNENNIKIIHALIIGPTDTPYENGIYYFTINISEKFPFESPTVKFETINGNIRFNPNLYDNGKVCLSILGTWPGPKWSPVQTIKSLLISIRSLLNENPIMNEPGYDNYKLTDLKSISYNKYIKYHNYSFALLEMLKNDSFYPYFKNEINNHLKKKYNIIIQDLSKLKKYDNELVNTLFWNKSIKLNFTKLEKDLMKYYKNISNI